MNSFFNQRRHAGSGIRADFRHLLEIAFKPAALVNVKADAARDQSGSPVEYKPTPAGSKECMRLSRMA